MEDMLRLEIADHTVSQIHSCNCYSQTCKGKYIKTRENQTECIWEYLRLGKDGKRIAYRNSLKKRPHYKSKGVIELADLPEEVKKLYEDKLSLNFNSTIVYKNRIYSNKQVSLANKWRCNYIMARQKEMGEMRWLKKYLNDKQFRKSEELTAGLFQLKALDSPKYNYRTSSVDKIKESIKNNLVKKEIGGVCSVDEANKYIRVYEIWRNINKRMKRVSLARH